LKQYRIGFTGLSTGTHRFSFVIGPAFFDGFQVAAFEEGSVKLELELEKTSTMLVLHFQFEGEVLLACDRCLESYSQPLAFGKRLLVKFGDAHAEQSDEIVLIPATESHVDIAQFVYEFIHLGLPLRHVHPDREDGSPGCRPEALETLRRHQGRQDEGMAKGDSPWAGLRNLRFDS